MNKRTKRGAKKPVRKKPAKPRAKKVRKFTGLDFRLTTPEPKRTLGDIFLERQLEAAREEIQILRDGIDAMNKEKAAKPARIPKTVQYPKDWWQAVKQRFAPMWALARWPVEYEVVPYWVEVSGEPVPIIERNVVLPFTSTPEQAKAAAKDVQMTPYQRGLRDGTERRYFNVTLSGDAEYALGYEEGLAKHANPDLE